MEIYDIVRSGVTNILLVTLLFTLAEPKYKPRVLWMALAAIVVSNSGLNFYFYLRRDYTSIAIWDLTFFVLVAIVTKPLFKDKVMQWFFNCIMAINIYAIIVILSYDLHHLFPYPHYSITVLRAIMFGSLIWLFRSRLRPLYRQAAEHWSVYLFVTFGFFVNFLWYFTYGDNIQTTLLNNKIPLLLLAFVAVTAYVVVFYSLKKNLQDAKLREEHLKIQSDRDLTRHRLSLMDETVRQMSIAQHDRRHFNNTLLSLIEQGKTEEVAALLHQQSEALPLKPSQFCQNIPVNAAVSYYAEMAASRGIRYNIRLDIPQKTEVDELSLAMAVSNLMENAIQAVSALPKEQREFTFIAVNTGQIMMEISNGYEGEISFSENGLPMAKEDGHGNGTRSIAQFVDHYHGELIFSAKNGIFKVRIML